MLSVRLEMAHNVLSTYRQTLAHSDVCGGWAIISGCFWIFWTLEAFWRACLDSLRMDSVVECRPFNSCFPDNVSNLDFLVAVHFHPAISSLVQHCPEFTSRFQYRGFHFSWCTLLAIGLWRHDSNWLLCSKRDNSVFLETYIFPQIFGDE